MWNLKLIASLLKNNFAVIVKVTILGIQLKTKELRFGYTNF